MKKSLGLCCTLLFVSCGTDPGPLAGGGSDQPNKIQAVRILRQDGQPAVGARVVSWSGAWDPIRSKRSTHRLDSGLTDRNGRWDVPVPSTDWYVTAQIDDQIAVCLPQQPEAVLGKFSKISGQISAAPGIVIDSFWMGGAGEAFLLQPKETFQLATQVGPRRIWGRVHWNGGVDTLLLAEKFLDTSATTTLSLRADTGSVLLISAESYPSFCSLRGQAFDAVDRTIPKAFDDIPSKPLVIVEGLTLLADWGRYFRWDMTDSTTAGETGPYHHIGFPLANRSLDWSGVESLQIHFTSGLRGNFRVKLATDRTDALPDGLALEYTIRPGNLSRDTVMILRLADFKPAGGSDALQAKLTWADVRHRVSRISFEAADRNATLELREIRAIGNRWQNW